MSDPIRTTHISAALRHIPRGAASPHGIAAEAPQQQPEDTPEERAIKRLFMLMHGRYGKPWLEKWSTGEMTEDGRDKGVLSAMRVWRIELRAFAPELLREAASRWKTTEQGKRWPPSLPEFEALCADLQRQHAAAAATRKAANPEDGGNHIEASPQAVAAHRAAVRERATAKMRASLSGRHEDAAPVDGLPGLLHLIASAAGLAGGDEAGALRRLERRVFKPMAVAA